jgi:hypothetical protein
VSMGESFTAAVSCEEELMKDKIPVTNHEEKNQSSINVCVLPCSQSVILSSFPPIVS